MHGVGNAHPKHNYKEIVSSQTNVKATSGNKSFPSNDVGKEISNSDILQILQRTQEALAETKSELAEVKEGFSSLKSRVSQIEADTKTRKNAFNSYKQRVKHKIEKCQESSKQLYEYISGLYYRPFFPSVIFSPLPPATLNPMHGQSIAADESNHTDSAPQKTKEG